MFAVRYKHYGYGDEHISGRDKGTDEQNAEIVECLNNKQHGLHACRLWRVDVFILSGIDYRRQIQSTVFTARQTPMTSYSLFLVFANNRHNWPVLELQLVRCS
jgi:hypothetical protein